MNYINLDLPSGTLWADENEYDFYEFDEAVSKYGDRLPTYEQLNELQTQCKWEWNGDGYEVTGPNGNSITLPAAGFRNCDGVVVMDSYGDYWSYTPTDSCMAWYLFFNFSSVCMHEDNRGYGFSVRLVKKKDNDMKDKEINIAEILKDCPEGTPLYSPIFGNVTFQCINYHNDIYSIMVNVPPHTSMFTKYGRYTEESGGECMLFPSKDNRDWNTFNVRPNFKKGDFVARVYYDGYATILLMGETDWSSQNNPVRYICYVDVYGGDFHVSQSTNCCWCSVNAFYDDDRYRLATDDEKKKLLDAIDKHGYVWDEEKLELKKKEHEFKPFDKVLFRDYGYVWSVGFFSHKTTKLGGNVVSYNIGGSDWDECIPYEGNEHLLGTTDNSDEKGGAQ